MCVHLYFFFPSCNLWSECHVCVLDGFGKNSNAAIWIKNIYKINSSISFLSQLSLVFFNLCCIYILLLPTILSEHSIIANFQSSLSSQHLNLYHTFVAITVIVSKSSNWNNHFCFGNLLFSSDKNIFQSSK